VPPAIINSEPGCAILYVNTQILDNSELELDFSDEVNLYIVPQKKALQKIYNFRL
jgi:hypothetical protein